MTIEHLKTATKTSATGAGDVRDTVQKILDEIEAGGDDAAKRYAAQFDKYEGDIIVSRGELDAAADRVPQKLKDDIRFAHDNVRRFAEAQKSTIQDMEYEVIIGSGGVR